MKEKENKGIIVALIIFIILTLLLGGYIVYDKVLSSRENKENENEIVNENETANNIVIKNVKLQKENEIFNEDELTIEFTGIKNADSDDFYNYTANIKYGDKIVDNSFFNDKNNYRIWSENMASEFKIYRIDSVYILYSSLASQCFDKEIMIFNTNGEVLKTFSRVDFSVEENNTIKIVTSDNLQCMGPDWEKHLKTYKYNISELNLNEVNN